jgi:16S rRNA (guanine527-N7)-methyltransferase
VQVQAPPEGFESRVQRALSSFDLPNVSARAKEQLIAYCELAVTWNQRVDLTAARNADELVDLLLADALAMLAARPGDAGEHWFDVGSGIGAPGIPLALLSPVKMTLVEPRTKRVAFLRTAAGALGRADISVSRSRSDEFLAASCDVAVSRATLPPPEWLKEGARLAKRSVWLLLAKAAVPDLDGRAVLVDTAYTWPLTGAQRRAVCVTAQSSRDAKKTDS